MAELKLQLLSETEDDNLDLLTKYWNEPDPQPVYVYLDLIEEEMWTSTWSLGENSFPEGVFNGTWERWRFSGTPTAEEANETMREISSLAMELLENATIYTDNGNVKGELDSEARRASDRIADIVRSANCSIVVREASEFMSCCDMEDIGVTAETTDEEIDKIVRETEFVSVDGIISVVDDLGEWIQEQRDYLAEEAEDKDIEGLRTAIENAVEEATAGGWDPTKTAATHVAIAKIDGEYYVYTACNPIPVDRDAELIAETEIWTDEELACEDKDYAEDITRNNLLDDIAARTNRLNCEE